MSRRIGEKQIEAVLKLDGSGRYDHFIKQVVDGEAAWGLWSDGWAMGADDDDRPTFPLWPAEEYAAVCANGDWEGFEPSEIDLDDLMNELLPKLEEDGVIPSIFLDDLANEKSRYE